MSRCTCFRCLEDRGCIRDLALDRQSTKHQGRWDPVVGAYVESDRQFRSLLAQGQDAQSEKLGMECKLVTADSRDTATLDHLHGTDPEQRKELAGRTKAQKAAR